MMKTERFPITVSKEGVSARIRKYSQSKNGKTYDTFIVEYSLLGKRKQEWRSSLEDARETAENACRLIARGQQVSLCLTDTDRMVYLRAEEALKPLGIHLDVAAQELAGATAILAGRATITEACREWVKVHATAIPDYPVTKATIELIQSAKADGKSAVRLKQLSWVLTRFAENFNVNVQDISPALVSQYLAKIASSERTKRNHRDVIGFFCRWLVMRGHLKRGTDWLEGVQNYTARKLGAIEIYNPEELKALLAKADKRLVPFLAIGAFTGMRHAEIARLDWSQIELSEGAGESYIEVRADIAKTQTRRLVPIKANLKAWLIPHRKAAGKVCPFENTTKQLLKVAALAGMEWKKNALRHSCISYRIAECGNVPLVADESGNSVQVIRTNYLRRVKPAVAVEWFSILPPRNASARKLALAA